MWLENVEDWCVSRQIWWGHRIPAWFCQDCGEVIVAEEDPANCPKCGGSKLDQEADVLDTWFSSALWPFSTMGWPDETLELKKFYPTSVLVTAFDILFFWVARMMMMGLHFMNEAPFSDVYIHALVRDAQGQKMSKSKGNVIDPLVVIDQYGTDAFRFTLAAFAVQGRDVKLSEERIEGYRHFVNKLWNASRLVFMNIEGVEKIGDIPEQPKSLMHRWILSRLQRVAGEVEQAVENYHFNQHAQALYQFVWREYCDWYLEMIKPDLYGEDAGAKAVAQNISVGVLERVLVLLHPIMPFVTEEIWSKLPRTEGSIMLAPFPEAHPEWIDAEAEAQMDVIMNVVSGIRNIRGEMGIAPAARLDVVCFCSDDAEKALLENHRGMVVDLARLSGLVVERAGTVEKPKAAAKAVAGNVEVYVLLAGVLDFDSESKRLQKEMAKLEKEISNTEKKLSNQEFLRKAPDDVVEKEKDKAARLGEKLDKLRHHLERIKELQQGG